MLSRGPIVEPSVADGDLKRLHLTAIKTRSRLGQALEFRADTCRLGPRRSEDDHFATNVSAGSGHLKGLHIALRMLEVGTVVVDARGAATAVSRVKANDSDDKVAAQEQTAVNDQRLLES